MKEPNWVLHMAPLMVPTIEILRVYFLEPYLDNMLVLCWVLYMVPWSELRMEYLRDQHWK